MANKVYACNYSQTLNAGATFQSTISILSVGRQIKIKSIALEWQFSNNTTGQYESPENTTTQAINLRLSPGAQSIAAPFVIGANPPLNNGNIINMYYPGQRLFDAFFITNTLDLILQIDNVSAADQYVHQVCIIIETEEKTMFL
jgi:hypothetical protein